MWGSAVGEASATRPTVRVPYGVDMSSTPTAQLRGAPSAPRRGRSGAPVFWALLVAAAAVVALVVTWRTFVHTYQGQLVDQLALEGAHIGRTRLWEIAKPLLGVVSIGFVAVAVLVTVLIAVLRRRWALAGAAVVVLAGSNVTTQLLKYWVLDRPHLGATGASSANTLPSGHTTVAASVAVAMLIVATPRLRPWVALLGAAYTAATGVSTLIGQWHRPSDVLAGVFVVLGWGALACAVLPLVPSFGTDRRPPTGGVAVVGRATPGRPAQSGTLVAAVLLLLVGLASGIAAAVALRRTWSGVGLADGSADMLIAYAGGALGVVAATALAFCLLVALRQGVTPRSTRAVRGT